MAGQEAPVKDRSTRYEGRPTSLSVLPDNIPPELKELPRWVLWRYEPPTEVRPDWAKVPYQARSVRAGRIPRASSTDPTTWSDFAMALEAYQRGRWDGIGYVFSRRTKDYPKLPNDLRAGVDLDDCLADAGTVAPWAVPLLDLVPTYIEVSPSGTGLKAFVGGTKPPAFTRCRCA